MKLALLSIQTFMAFALLEHVIDNVIDGYQGHRIVSRIRRAAKVKYGRGGYDEDDHGRQGHHRTPQQAKTTTQSGASFEERKNNIPDVNPLDGIGGDLEGLIPKGISLDDLKNSSLYSHYFGNNTIDISNLKIPSLLSYYYSPLSWIAGLLGGGVLVGYLAGGNNNDNRYMTN